MDEYIEREAFIKRLEVTPILKYGVPAQVRDVLNKILMEDLK